MAKRTTSKTLTAKDVRRALRGARTVSDLYEGTMLKARYQTDPVYAWFQGRHKRGKRFIDEDGYYRSTDEDGRRHRWKVPYGYRAVMGERLLWTHMVSRYPWYVTWQSPKTGKRLKKYVGSLPAGIKLIAEQIQYVDPSASVVSRNGWVIPQPLRGKFPRKGHYWCPCCMQPRRFKRQYYSTGDPMVTYAQRKVWNESKGVYEQIERKVALMRCPVCRLTNRDEKFKRSNQPYEKMKVKRGVTRVKRRKGRRSRG